VGGGDCGCGCGCGGGGGEVVVGEDWSRESEGMGVRTSAIGDWRETLTNEERNERMSVKCEFGFC